MKALQFIPHAIAVALLLGTSFPALAENTPPKLSAEDTEFFLEEFLADDLKFEDTQVKVEGETVVVALNLAGETSEDMMSKIILVLWAAEAAASWTDKVQVIAYLDELPVLGIEVETPVITAFIDEEIEDEDFIDTWKFAVIEE